LGLSFFVGWQTHLRLAEEAGMVFPVVVVEAEADELEVLNTRQLCERGTGGSKQSWTLF
jgi:hypothetical protein